MYYDGYPLSMKGGLKDPEVSAYGVLCWIPLLHHPCYLCLHKQYDKGWDLKGRPVLCLLRSYPAGTELLTDTAKLYKAALGNCFKIDDWGPIEFSIMAKHFDRQGKPPYAYHAQYLAHLLSHGQPDGSG